MKKLYYELNNEQAKIGDRVVTFRGEMGTLVDIIEPKHKGSTGRVAVLLDNCDIRQYFFPSVINAEWRG